MTYLNKLMGAGVTLTLSDYRELDSITRDDIVLWNDAASQKREDELELARLGGARTDG